MSSLGRCAADADLLASREELRKVLQAIYVECAGPGRPSSPDSYLPPHLVDLAREALTQASGKQIPIANAHSCKRPSPSTTAC